MSEFKYACPVCGQHMVCDSSQSGSVMECPTCFQKIVAPQTPADADRKFILTGTKYTEKKIPATLAAAAAAATAAPEKNFPLAIVIVLAVALAAGAVLFFFGGKVFHHEPATAWQTGDIGEVSAAGSFSHTKGTYVITGDGGDIWSQSDAFRYVYHPLNGEVTLAVRVVDIQNTDPWAKAGLMIRESLNPNSAYVMVFVSPLSGVSFQQRDRTAGWASVVQTASNLSAPCWIRLTRQNNDFTAYSSADGKSWETIGSTTVSMENPAFAGLAVCSHQAGTLCRATFDNVTVEVRQADKADKTKTNASTNPGGKVKSPVVAPPPNDTNWTLAPDVATVPDATAAGRIHAQDFIIERASLQNGTLTLREGSRGPVEFGLTINFSGAPPEALSGQSINITTNADKAARVTLRWREDGQMAKASFDNSYALRLQFGALANNRLPGKIYLCLPDAEKSYLLGTFNADARPPKPKLPKK